MDLEIPVSWMLVFYLFYRGGITIVVERFESETRCNKAAEIIAEPLPKNSAAVKVTWTCTNTRVQ